MSRDDEIFGVAIPHDTDDPVPADLLVRAMQVSTAEESGALLNAIVDAVEHVHGSPLCQRNDDLTGPG